MRPRHDKEIKAHAWQHGYNRATDFVRKASRPEHSPTPPQHEADPATVAEEADWQEEQWKVYRAWEAEDPQGLLRVVHRLCVIKKLKHRQIAKEFGVERSTVSRWIREARHQLRDRLCEEGDAR